MLIKASLFSSPLSSSHKREHRLRRPMGRKDSDSTPRVRKTIYLNEETVNRIMQRAEDENRTFNNMIETYLEICLNFNSVDLRDKCKNRRPSRR